MPDLGPLNVFICWQTILFSIGISLISGGIKSTIDYFIGKSYLKEELDGNETEVSVGKEIRKSSRFLTRVLMPSVPLLIGAILALFVPLIPDLLVAYIKTVKNGWLVLMFYGATCGVVADYVYNHYKKNFLKS
jgi:hypothetical protein